MRYAIISDIHGNREALDAVVAELADEHIDGYVCAGDVVGYGADPVACLARVRSLGRLTAVAGNHEWGVLGRTPRAYFNSLAAAAVEWTSGLLTPVELDYLGQLPLTDARGDFEVVHGSLERPDDFTYIVGPADARECLKRMAGRLCFVGHTHRVGIWSSDGGHLTAVKASSVVLKEGRRYLVNTGSVGQPRDGDPRASYVVYDDEAGRVDICRVPYDIALAQKKIRAAGLPKRLAERLAEGL